MNRFEEMHYVIAGGATLGTSESGWSRPASKGRSITLETS
jgi:hypothetical protein